MTAPSSHADAVVVTRTARAIDASVPAIVLQFDPNVMRHGGLGLIRSRSRTGFPVYGVHEDRLAPAANSGYLRGRFFWRPEAGDADRVIGGPAVLIPADDAGATFLAEHGAGRRMLGSVPAMLAGEIVMYAVGVVWLGAYLHVGAGKAIALGLTPFLAGDAIKAAAAALLLPGAWRLAGRR